MPEPHGNAQGPSTHRQAQGRPDDDRGTTAPGPAAAGRRQSMLMRISVPAEGDFREVAGEVGTKIAEFLGSRTSDAASLVAGIEGLAGKVAPPGGGSSDITFEFHAVKGELVVHANCDGRSSEMRHRLPA